MTICDRLTEGESLRSICRDAGMPDKATVFRWIARHDVFRRDYALAREAQTEDICYEILQINRGLNHIYMEHTDADGKVTRVLDHEHIARSSLKINALFRTAALLAPKKYGDH